MDQKLIDAVTEARGTRADTARPEIVTHVHTKGRLTARERLELLLDEDSAVEYGSIAGKTGEGDWIAETGGVDLRGQRCRAAPEFSALGRSYALFRNAGRRRRGGCAPSDSRA